MGSFNSIDGGITVKKPIKYCDFTGFHANYTDPKTQLRYYDKEFYPICRNMAESAKDDYLSLRKANVILK